MQSIGQSSRTILRAPSVLAAASQRLASSRLMLKFVIALTFVVLSVVVGVALCAWIWAMVFMHLNVFDDLETAVYFSLVTFTTLGYGDITLDAQWRLLSGLTASNGLIVFGLNTAFLVDVLSRLGRAKEPNDAAD